MARFRPLIRPFWPPVDVDWVICTLADIHESSPWVETIDSPASRIISRSGMVVPLTSACMGSPSRLRSLGAKLVSRRSILPGAGASDSGSPDPRSLGNRHRPGRAVDSRRARSDIGVKGSRCGPLVA